MPEAAIRTLQFAVADALNTIVAAGPGGDRQRLVARIGPPEVLDDLMSIGSILQAREALDTLSNRLPAHLRNLGDPQIASIGAAMKAPALQTPQVLPFALSLVMNRLAAPWQIIRLALAMAGSDDEVRVAATPYGVAVTMVIHDLSCLVTDLRQDMKQGRLDSLSLRLKAIHDCLRGLRTELDVRKDSAWGKRLSAIRVDISNTLRSELEGIPTRVRRVLRQRPDKEMQGLQFDQTETEKTAALIDFAAVCRNYASELAINEVALRTFSDVQHYIESTTESLVESLRASGVNTHPYRRMQAEAAVRFCEVLLGRDYASQMKKAVDVAISGERKSSRVS